MSYSRAVRKTQLEEKRTTQSRAINTFNAEAYKAAKEWRDARRRDAKARKARKKNGGK